MVWGAYVIVAVIVWPNGQVTAYHPSTLLDRDACVKQATQINTEWRAEGEHGVATCRREEENQVP